MGAEVKRIYSGHVDFNSYSRETTIPLVSTDSEALIDLELAFYTLPTLAPLTPGQGLTGGYDYRVYINDFDVTSQVIRSLQDFIRHIPGETIKNQYLEGANNYLNFIRSLGTRNEETKNDDEKARSIAATEDWTKAFETLGDRTFGWSGNLHPVSFIYRQIPLSPISLSEVWSKFRQSAEFQDLPDSLSDLPLRSITFGQGPSARDGIFDAKSHLPAGRLSYQFEVLYINPLKRPLERILARLKDMAKDIESMRTQYLEPSLTGIEEINQDMDKLEQSLNERIRQLTETVENIGP